MWINALILMKSFFFFFLSLSLVCDNMERYNSASPFLCMDLTYITVLLKEGFGFRDNTVLQVRKKPS